jgi:hypothetical protein
MEAVTPKAESNYPSASFRVSLLSLGIAAMECVAKKRMAQKLFTFEYLKR